MSPLQINLSPDLKKLRDEGYELEIRHNYLLINSIPYLNSSKEIKLGTLVSELTIAGQKTGDPKNHIVHFIGEYPCNKDGSTIHQIKHNSITTKLAEGIVTNHSFSNKPKNGYADYYKKMTRYVEIISAPVRSMDSSLTAQTFRIIESGDEDSVFKYPDTNSSRAEIIRISDKLKDQKIGIIGLGGTGSYILDLVAKSPVKEIHLFDGDKFLLHNSFRAPGAASIEEINKTPMKTNYYKEKYSKMHKYIFSHHEYIDSTNVGLISSLNFVFICLDKSKDKKLIVNKLEEFKISFIDVGMGIETVDDSLIGILRVTASTESQRNHVRNNNRISFTEHNAENEYSQNIQIAELNSLNAALAVIKWKKLCGFYQDLEKEYFCTYSINVNMLLSDENDS